MTKEVLKAKMNNDRLAYEGMLRNIDFQVDTLTAERANHTGGYFTRGRNAITVNYIPGNTKWNEWTESENVAIHEQKHRDNASQGFYAYAVSPEQAYKREMHDEISANMASLIALRQRYLETGDLTLFDRVENGRFAFYKQAIEKGEIKPNSPYQEDFDKEMRLIVNGTQKMWIKNFGNGSYIENGTYHYLAEGDFEGKYAEYWDENYQNALKIAYNIGGIDFTQYMEKDVEIPQAANSKIVEELSEFTSYYKEKNSLLTDDAVNKIIFERSGLPAYDGSISLSQYKKLLQHQTAVNNFASGNSYSHEDGSVTVYSPQEYLKKLNSRETIEEYRKFYNDFTDPKVEGSDEAKKEFPTFESYRRYRQDFYAKDYNENFSSTCGDEKFIDKMVEYQAAEYAKTGKKFPPAENEENYQKALNKIYCGAYDVLHPDENKLKMDISDKALQIMNDAKKSWFDKLRDKAQSFKHRLTHITDENGKEQNVGLWGKIKHKAKQIKEDLTTEVEIDEDGTKWVGECSVWKGLKNKISSWFKPSPQQEPIKNEPINPVNKDAPEYPKWSKDNRVSPVQHRPILDMRKPIIKQPTISRSAMKNVDKSSIKNKMSADKTNAQKASHQQENVEKKAVVRSPDTWEQIKRLVGWSRD